MAIAAVALMIGCTKEEERPNGEVETFDSVPMEFKFSPYEMSPMKTPQNVATVCSRLDIYIIEQGTTDTLRFHQDRAINATGFGSLTTTLQTNRSYKLVVVGHSTSDTATFQNGLISFTNDIIKQTLYADTVFSPGDGLSLQVVMQRIVGMFKMRVADEIPQEVTHMVFNISNTGRKWNTATHESADRGPRTHTINGLNRGNDGYVTFNIYVMADDMTDVTYCDIEVQAQNANNQAVETRQFTQVPIKDNYITTYTGTFFVTFDMGFTFLVDDWQENGSYTF